MSMEKKHAPENASHSEAIVNANRDPRTLEEIKRDIYNELKARASTKQGGDK
jgi:hypothetical protein